MKSFFWSASWLMFPVAFLAVLVGFADRIPATGHPGIDQHITALQFLAALANWNRRNDAPLNTLVYLWLGFGALSVLADRYAESRGRGVLRILLPSLDPEVHSAGESQISETWDSTDLCTTLRGTYRGRLIIANLRCRVGSRTGGPRFALRMACNAPLFCAVQKKGIAARLEDLAGKPFSESGDPELDKEMVFSTSDTPFMRAWVRNADVKQFLHSLVVEHGASFVTCAESRLAPFAGVEASYYPYHFYYREHLPALLDLLYGLAVSLESKQTLTTAS